jgi:hypothetical protein
VRHEKSHPSWWQLYVLGLAMIGLLVLWASDPLPEGGHEVAEIGTVLLACGLVELWLRANRSALLRVSRRTLAQTPRPQIVWETWEPEHQPILVSRRWPQEEDARPQTEGTVTLRAVKD